MSGTDSGSSGGGGTRVSFKLLAHGATVLLIVAAALYAGSKAFDMVLDRLDDGARAPFENAERLESMGADPKGVTGRVYDAELVDIEQGSEGATLCTVDSDSGEVRTFTCEWTALPADSALHGELQGHSDAIPGETYHYYRIEGFETVEGGP